MFHILDAQRDYRFRSDDPPDFDTHHRYLTSLARGYHPGEEIGK